MGPCERNAERWLDHLYGLLSHEESLELTDHLALCPSCRASLAEAERDQRARVNQAKADTLRLVVVGAAETSADAPYSCRIATRDLDGHLLAAQLDVRLVRTDSGEVIHQHAVASAGEVEVVIPAGLKLD